MSEKLIRASEIGEYVYCRRAWWLRHVQGYAPENVRELARGTRFHATHGRSVQRAHFARKLGYGLLIAAVLAFAYWWIIS